MSVNRALDLGVHYIETAAADGRGISQAHIGAVMVTRRDDVFLATKTHAPMRPLESLRRHAGRITFCVRQSHSRGVEA